MKISRQKVDEVIDFVGKYISAGIRSGSLDTFCIPYFGKFIGKPRQAYHIDRLKSIPKPAYNNNLYDPEDDIDGTI